MSRTLGTLLMCAPLSMAAGVAFASPPANSPYMTDAQSSYVQDATSDSIGSVNMITCVMSSMRPDALVNQGAYIALIDQNVCNGGVPETVFAHISVTATATATEPYGTGLLWQARDRLLLAK